MNKSLILISFVVGLSFLLVGGANTSQNVDLSPSNNQPVSVNTNLTSTSSALQDLQLQTFNGTVTSPSPAPVTPSNPCPMDVPGAIDPNSCICSSDMLITCQNSKCVKFVDSNPDGTSYIDNGCINIDPIGAFDHFCTQFVPNGTACVAKPVIYLYPTKPTNVSVKIQTTGEITVSDPLYGDGWDNILAFPSGNLIYNNKAYDELFYETDVKDVDPVSGGILVATKDVKNSLYDLTAKLGLIKPEQDELVNWWTPRLEALNKPYILVSLIDSQTKELIDKVEVTPQPDTRIEFLLYFKGLDQEISVPSLNLPPTPQRKGFTEVEWGGTIDYQ